MNVPKLRFKEFNDEWQTSKIGDFCKVLMCKRIFANETSIDYEIPFYKIGTIGGVPDTYISRQLFEEYKTKYNYPKKGELLITCSGTVGKCTIFDGHDSYYQDSNIVWLDNPTLKINNDFLYYLLSKVDWSKLNSTTIVRIYGDNLRQLRVSFPTRIEQDKITKTLNLLDKKIELQTKKIEDLKLFKKGILNELVNNIIIDKTYKLNDIGISYTGISGKTKEDFNHGSAKYIPFINILKNNININNLPSIDIKPSEKQNKVMNGDLFFTISSETKEEVGMCATLKEIVTNVYLNSFCFGFRIKNMNIVDNEFLCYLLLSNKYRKIISNLGQGFTRVNLSKTQLMEIEIKIPKLEVQKKIANTISFLEKHINLEIHKLDKLEKLKKGLMQNIFV